jgi:hypothetical protein
MFPAADLINMLEFLIDNKYAMFYGSGFQQIFLLVQTMALF